MCTLSVAFLGTGFQRNKLNVRLILGDYFDVFMGIIIISGPDAQ